MFCGSTRPNVDTSIGIPRLPLGRICTIWESFQSETKMLPPLYTSTSFDKLLEVYKLPSGPNTMFSGPSSPSSCSGTNTSTKLPITPLKRKIESPLKSDTYKNPSGPNVKSLGVSIPASPNSKTGNVGTPNGLNFIATSFRLPMLVTTYKLPAASNVIARGFTISVTPVTNSSMKIPVAPL